jgi:hypothetical protein
MDICRITFINVVILLIQVCSIKLHLLLLEVLFDLNANIHTSGQIPSSMLSKSLEQLFNFGRVLALTPSYRKPETSLLQKCYALAIITLIID